MVSDRTTRALLGSLIRVYLRLLENPQDHNAKTQFSAMCGELKAWMRQYGKTDVRHKGFKFVLTAKGILELERTPVGLTI